MPVRKSAVSFNTITANAEVHAVLAEQRIHIERLNSFQNNSDEHQLEWVNGINACLWKYALP